MSLQIPPVLPVGSSAVCQPCDTDLLPSEREQREELAGLSVTAFRGLWPHQAARLLPLLLCVLYALNLC